MSTEKALASFIKNSDYSDLCEETIKTVKLQTLAFCGALAAGSATAADEAVKFVCEMGGKPEATVFVHGVKLPAHIAAFANATIGRALDIDDHISPGAHIGGAVVPAAFAASELIGGCSGKDFITAVATGTEVSLRLMLEEEDYSGFDPTGVTAGFGATAAATKLLGFDENLIWNSLGLAFDKCGASFQHFIDGVLGGPVMQGWVAQTGVECARLAKCGMTGIVNFLEGIYGYFHLYGRDKADISYVAKDLGKQWNLKRLNFKPYPSCGMTQSSTELILSMMEEHGLNGNNTQRVEIRIPPYAFKLVGHPFKIGPSPRVDAQFSVAYCLANALLRAPVLLSHFDAEQISDPKVVSFVKEKITVVSDPVVDRTHYSADIRIWTNDGKEHFGQIDTPPGTPKKPMSLDAHRRRLYDCIDFSGKQWLKGREEAIIDFIDNLEAKEDVCGIIPLFLP